MAGDVVAVKEDLSVGWRQKLGDEVETSAFASTIWANNGVNGVSSHLQVDVIDGYKTEELLGQAASFDHKVCFMFHKSFIAPTVAK